MGLTNAGFARTLRLSLPCTAEGAARTSCRVGNHCRVAWSCGKNERDKIDTSISHALSITFFSLSFYFVFVGKAPLLENYAEVGQPDY